jgi:subtilisin family serine protease
MGNGLILLRVEIFIRIGVILIALLSLGSIPRVAASELSSPTPDWRAKVDGSLLKSSSQTGSVEFLLFLHEQADLSDLGALEKDGRRSKLSRVEKGAAAVARLQKLAAVSQSSLVDGLARARSLAIESGLPEFRSFWAANMIWVRGSGTLMRELALDPAVARVMANPRVQFSLPPQPSSDRLPSGIAGIESNLSLVGAPQVWSLGISGEGVVIGGQDTGYEWDHPALKNQYRGWDGSTVDHAYNWHDAIHSGGGSCGADSSVPCDDHNHGTHTMGIMVGDDGGGNQIGMAPGARWIGCRNMDVGFGTPATYTECFQWFMAPTDENGLNPDVSKAPHVINNSWSCPDFEGCVDPLILETVVNNVRSSGIFLAVSATNDGPSCNTIVEPPAIYEGSFTVAATKNSDDIANFSSRGPVTVGGGPAKPDISAPGVSIRSSIRGGAYSKLSGTSMAGPHVAGLVALLISASPELAGEINSLESIIEASALPLTTSEGCGGDGPTDIPNHTFGHGRIDAHAAVLSIPVPTPGLSPIGLVFLAAAFLFSALLFARIPALEKSGKSRRTSTSPR